MQTTVLGQTGLTVSRYCLGAMMFGELHGLGNTDKAECIRIIHRAIDAGINFIDTADVYSRGGSEEIVAEAIKGRRENLVIATKFAQPMDDDPGHRGGSRRWIVREVEASLKRLGTDYIDLYQMHRYDASTDLEEVMFTLTELVRQGKIRYFGSSMFAADRIVESHWIAEKRGLMRFRCEQPWYSIFSRDVERAVLPACHRYGMGAITFSPLDGGYLTDKYQSSKDLGEDSRVAFIQRVISGSFDPEDALNTYKLELARQLRKVAADAGLTLAQLSMAFVLRHPYVTSAILGPRKLEHLETLLPAADVKLDDEVLDKIDELVPPGSNVNRLIDWPNETASRRA